MQFLKFIKNYLVHLGLYRPDSIDQYRYYKYQFSLFLLSMITVLMGIPLFNMRTVAEIAVSSYGVSQIAVVGVGASSMLWRLPNIYKLIDKFEEILRKYSERPDFKITYEKMYVKVEKYSKIPWALIYVSILGPMLLLFLYVSFVYVTKGLEVDDYRLIYPIWLPIDWKTSLYTYLTAFAVDIFGAYLISKLGGVILSFMIASFMVMSRFTEDIKQEMLTMNDNWKTNRNKKELMENICGITWFIARTNECMREMSTIFEISIFSNFIWSLASICDSLILLQIELSKEAINMGVLGPLMAAVIVAFGTVFAFCEFGEQLGSRMEEINDTICTLDWNTYPISVQRMLPMIIQTTQNPIEITAYLGIPCSRETNKKIVNTGYSYFNVFRA